jgi:glycerate 2-kinase
MGIGGSATNDGGFGLARAMGWRFVDLKGAAINTWTGLKELGEARPPRRRRWFRRFIVAVDVQNPLLGARGATQVYGPQKGLQGGDFDTAESCLRQLARVARRQLRRDFSRCAGAGAAGGLGFGLPAFLGAELTPGFRLFASLSGMDRCIRRADYVLTGEGAIDGSTLMGKGVGELAKRCLARRRPCLALAGTVTASQSELKMFGLVRALTDLTVAAEARTDAAKWLGRLSERTARELQLCGTPAR